MCPKIYLIPPSKVTFIKSDCHCNTFCKHRFQLGRHRKRRVHGRIAGGKIPLHLHGHRFHYFAATKSTMCILKALNKNKDKAKHGKSMQALSCPPPFALSWVFFVVNAPSYLSEVDLLLFFAKKRVFRAPGGRLRLQYNKKINNLTDVSSYYYYLS